MASGKSSAQNLANELNQLAGYERFYADFAALSNGTLVDRWAVYDKKTGRNYVIGSFAGDIGITQLKNELKKQSSDNSKGSIKSTKLSKLSLRHEDTDFNEEEQETDVEHYGVLGMKWGVRKDANKAYSRASNKLNKLDRKANDASARASKIESKSVDKQRKADSARIFKKSSAKKAIKAIEKSDRARLDYVKKMEKAVSWYKQMENTFKDVKLSNVSSDHIKLGEKYSKICLDDLMANSQTSWANKELMMYYKQRK